MERRYERPIFIGRCHVCDVSLAAYRADARYCGDECRMIAYRYRNHKRRHAKRYGIRSLAIIKPYQSAKIAENALIKNG